jgi:hypothetical protein
VGHKIFILPNLQTIFIKAFLCKEGIFISFLLVIGIFSYAQKSHYDSIKKVLQEDRLEYEQDKKNADRIKQEADSMLNKELGHIERITPAEDTAAIKKKMRAIAALELQKRARRGTEKLLFIRGYVRSTGYSSNMVI